MGVSLLTVVLTDGEGATKTVAYHLPDTTTKAQAEAWLVAAAAKLDDLTGCELTSATFTQSLVAGTMFSGLKADPVAGSRVDSGATLTFDNSAGVAYSQYIPGFLASKLVNKIVVATDQTVVDYAELMVDGFGGGVPVDQNGLDIAAFNGGKQATRK